MTNEETLKALRMLWDKEHETMPTRQAVQKGIDICMDALKNGIPAEPIKENYVYYCSVCGEELESIGDRFNYCPHCGRAVDWSKNEL